MPIFIRIPDVASVFNSQATIDNTLFYRADYTWKVPPKAIGWTPIAYPVNHSPSLALTTPLNLPANGGSIAIPVHVAGYMALESASIYGTDILLSRSWRWDVYEQVSNSGDSSQNTLTRCAASNGSQTFTASIEATHTLSVTNPPVYLEPGLYWLVIQSTHATNTFGLGSTAVVASFAPNCGQTKTTTNPNGATLDFVAATWTKTSAAYAACLNGRVFGQTSAF